MRNYLAFVTLLTIFSIHIQAQVVTENVHFDFYQSISNNDLVNYFNNGLGMAQIQTNGITGGCLTVPDSISWGNDDAIYCSHYHPNSGDTTITSVNFKYDSSTVKLSSYQRAITIFLHPSVDFNHYVIATVSGDKKIELITYGWVNSPYPYLNLLHDHWYNYKLSTAFLSATQVYVKADVYDLGLMGTSIPALVNTSSGSFTDNILATDTSIQVSVSATSFGGCHYLDDFSFHGRKGVSNCVTSTGINNPKNFTGIEMYYSSIENIIRVTNNNANDKMNVSVFNVCGNKMTEILTMRGSGKINTSALADGFYTARCESEGKIRHLKFVVSH